MDITTRLKEIEEERKALAIRREKVAKFIKVLDEELEDFRLARINKQQYE